MRVLVTGASGRLGRVVCRQLAAQGDEVVAADSRYAGDLGMAVHVMDVRDRMAIYPLLAGCQAVVHLANHPDMTARLAPQTIYADNTIADVNVFQAASDTGVRQVVYASSVQAISGFRQGRQDIAKPSVLAYLPVDGEMPTMPGSLYALGKHAGEGMLRFYAACEPGRSSTAIRFPWLVNGPGWFQGSRQTMPGRLDEVFGYLDFEDAAAFIRAVLAANRPGYACCHPASPENRLGWRVADTVRVFYPQVALRRPLAEMPSLIDLEPLRARYGWSASRIHRPPPLSMEGVSMPAG